MKKNRRLLINIMLILLILLGAVILLYPAVSNWFNTQQHQKMITSYKADVNELPESFVEEEWQKAVTYNESLIGLPVKDPFMTGSGMALAGNYMNVLNFNGVMGYIDIPSINIHLPIYHGTSEAALKKGVGHLENSAFPIGGEGTNPILSAHTGIPTAKLFTDLVEVKKGDMFSIRVMNRTMYYKVDNIVVIRPDETKNLFAISGKDYATLITCTPYGINSHRLVVRGERCYELAESFVIAGESRLLWRVSLICSGVLAFIFLIMIIVNKLREGKRKAYTKSVGKHRVAY